MDKTDETREAGMFTIIAIQTNEAVSNQGDPVLFDTEAEAADYCVQNQLDGRLFSIVDVDDVITEEV